MFKAESTIGPFASSTHTLAGPCPTTAMTQVTHHSLPLLHPALALVFQGGTDSHCNVPSLEPLLSRIGTGTSQLSPLHGPHLILGKGLCL